MSYEQELTFHLRLRGRTEDEIGETIRELRAHGVASTGLRDEFGSPAEYADGFEKRPRKNLGSTISATATILAIAWMLLWIGVAVVRRFALGIDDAGAGFPPLLPIAFAIGFSGLAAGFLVDRWRPPRVA